MKLYTSYFYQIRFFAPNIVPVSTAVWDPKWYHNFAGQDNVFLDKRGVVNGLRAPALAPGSQLEGSCAGKDGTAVGCTHNPSTCAFLRGYADQLNRLDCDDYVHRLENLGSRIKRITSFEGEPVIVLIVYEAPDNPCSERAVLQQWLSTNGYEISEWRR
jgi:hypothetical protein